MKNNLLIKRAFYLVCLIAMAIPGFGQLPTVTYASNLNGSGNGNSVAFDASGNTYVTGWMGGVVDFDPSAATATLNTAGGSDIFLAKYSPTGAYLWAIAIGSTGSDVGNGVYCDAAGNVYLTGYFSGTVDFDPSVAVDSQTALGGTDGFVAKYNVSGNYQWAFQIGGTGADIGSKITVDASTSVLVTGEFNGSVDFDPSAANTTFISSGFADVYVAKYSTAGAFQWAIPIGGAASETAGDVAVDPTTGNVYVGGANSSTNTDFDPSLASVTVALAGGADAFVAKYSATGACQWAIGLGGSSTDILKGLTVDASGNCYVTGSFRLSGDWDPSATAYSLTAVGGSDIFLAKYNTAGAMQWAYGFGNTVNDVGWGLSGDASGNIYLIGAFGGTINFDPTNVAPPVTSVTTGFFDVCVAKYNSAGTYLTAFSVGGPNGEVGTDICNDASSNFAITGWHNQTGDWDPSAAVLNLTATSGGQDCFVAKYSNAPCSPPLAPTNTTSVTNQAICNNSSAALSVTGSGSFNWFSTSTSTTVISTGSLYVTPSLTTGVSPTTYTFYANANTCTVSVTRTPITITVNPTPTITVVSSTSLLCVGQTATLTGGGANTYTWNPGGIGTSISASPSVTASYTITGTSVNSCINSSIFTLSVSACTGINQFTFTNNEVNIYPNPTNGIIIVNIPINLLALIEIYNLLGERIPCVQFSLGEGMGTRFDLSEKSSGIYFVRITSTQGSVTKKIFKE